jgi:hypothetical protein
MTLFLRRIIYLSLARMILDMLLPEGDAGRYADLGVGLCMMLCMLEEIRSIL